MRQEPYLPTRLGFGALTELGSVDWSSLQHCYGVGVVGTGIAGDVEGSLALLSEDYRTAIGEGLFSNVCHQGTIYEATAYAVPFISAVAAGEIPTEPRRRLTNLLGEIAIGSSLVTTTGTSLGSWGPGVDVLVRNTFLRSDSKVAAIHDVEPSLRMIIQAIRTLVTHPSESNRLLLDHLLDPDQ